LAGKPAISSKPKSELATFAAGCFWGVEETFRQLTGVLSTYVGYTGGNFENPTYKDVCTDKTGHVEAVQIEFDPKLVTFEKLLDIFWSSHNPTTPNQQGPDYGSQYRSAIFFHSKKQQQSALKSMNGLERSGKWEGRKIVTQIVPASKFFKAEEHHQKYLMKKGLSSCHF